MRSRPVRTGLLLLAVVSVLSTAYLCFRIERRVRSAADTAQSVETRIATAIRQTFDLRSAQQAYVSHGQQERFWIPKVATASAALRESLAGLNGVTTAAASRTALDGAQQALQEFERMDKRAREHVSLGQKLLASDLIFSDGLETTDEIVTALEQTRYVEASDAATARSVARREQATFAGSAAAIALLVICLLMPLDESRQVSGETLKAPRDGSADDYAVAPLPETPEEFEFRLLASEPKPPAAPVEPAEAVADPQPNMLNTRRDFSRELETVADVCAELARVGNPTSLSPALERAATALDASGVMLWVADPDARELTAIASHGYASHVLSRIGRIPKEAQNVTAAAFRTGLLQTLPAGSGSPGAIAAPLVNPSGCIGVMSAEVAEGVEREPARLAFASIVAAQLATLVAPATRVHSRTEAI